MVHPDSGRHARLWKGGKHQKWIRAIMASLVIILLCSTSFAAEKFSGYQVVNGGDDKTYLLDTSSDFVWVLTYLP
jgi:hypothetical protein